MYDGIIGLFVMYLMWILVRRFDTVPCFYSLFCFVRKIMPQLVPFFFVNEITFTFVIIAITVYILSKYILPRFVRLFLSRTFISKLLDNSINK